MILKPIFSEKKMKQSFRELKEKVQKYLETFKPMIINITEYNCIPKLSTF